jgi:hypothetical protein
VIQITPEFTVSQNHRPQKGAKKWLFPAIFVHSAHLVTCWSSPIRPKTVVVVLEISYSFACTCRTVASWALFSPPTVAPGHVTFFVVQKFVQIEKAES